MEKEELEVTTDQFNWKQVEFTEQQIMNAPLESKLDKLMDLTSPAAVNTAVEKFVEDWLIEELEKNDYVVSERKEV